MSYTRSLLGLLAALVLTSLPSRSHATTPTAYLSWERDSRVEDLQASPGSRTPLYMRVCAPPVGYQALASQIRWTPCDIFGPCYGVFSDSTSGLPDGYWEFQPEGLALGADSSYYYSLHPREDAGDLVFKFMVGGGACGLRPASICLDWLKFIDASGDTVYADVLGGATLFGGDGGCSFSMQQISPTVVAQSEATTFDLLGGGFGEGMSAELVGETETRTATTLAVLSAGHVQATFDTRSMAGPAEVILVSASGDSASTVAQIVSGVNDLGYEQHSVILWARPGRLTLPTGVSDGVLSVASAPPALMANLETLGVLEVRSCVAAFLQDPAAAAKLESPAILDLFVLSLADTNVASTCAALTADTANVRACHPDWYLAATDVVPNDPLMPKSWHLRNTGTFPAPDAVVGADSRASRAWAITTGGTPVRIGAMDTGSWTTHPDLVGRYSNGWRYDPSATFDDLAGHGAPVAGIIGATGNGGGQAVGVNWSAEIVSIKAGYDNNTFLWSNVVGGLAYATAAGIKFVNMSFAGAVSDPDMEEAVFNAFHADMFLAAGSGNGDFGTTPCYPADIYPYVVSVGASLWTDQRWRDDQINWGYWGYTENTPVFFSVAGNHPRLLAPGGRFIPTIFGSNGYRDPDPRLLYLPSYPTQPYRFDPSSPWRGFGGTSAAAPVVTGAASLVRSQTSDSLGAEEIAHLLAMTARPTDLEYPGYNASDGWGIVDIEQALWAVRPGMRIERGVAVGGGVVTDTVAGPIVDLVEFPGLPSGLYSCKSSAYNVRRKVVFAQPFAVRPLVLKRTHGSAGALTIPVQIRGTALGPHGSIPRWEPSIDTLAAYPDSCVLTTRVWALYKDGIKYWWPCPPEAARFAYTLVGIPLSALDVRTLESDSFGLRLSAGPSPTRDQLTIELAGTSGTTVDLDLLDVQGRRVRSLGSHTLSSDARRLVVGLGDAGRRPEPGLYFLRATTSSTSVTRRVVVIR